MTKAMSPCVAEGEAEAVRLSSGQVARPSLLLVTHGIALLAALCTRPLLPQPLLASSPPRPLQNSFFFFLPDFTALAGRPVLHKSFMG